MDMSPNGSLILTGDSNFQIILWSVMSGNKLRQHNYENDIVHVAFSPDGHHCFVSSMDGVIGVWKVPDLKRVADVDLDDEIVRDAVFSTDSRKIFACTLSGKILEIGTLTGNVQGTWDLGSDRGQLNSVDIGIGRIIGAFSSGYLVCWELESRTELWSIQQHTSIFNIRVSPDTKAVATASKGLFIHDVDSGSLLQSQPTALPNKVRFSETPTQVIYPEDSTNELILWDWSTNTILGRYGDHSSQIYAVAINNNYIVSGGNDGKIVVRERQSGKVIWDQTIT